MQQFAFVPGAHETPAASQLPVGSATGAATGAVGVVGSATGGATGGDPIEVQMTPFQLHPVAFLHIPPLVWMEHGSNAVGAGVIAIVGLDVGAFVAGTVGEALGEIDGDFVGKDEGEGLGFAEGWSLGFLDGLSVLTDGVEDGDIASTTLNVTRCPVPQCVCRQ